MWTSFHEKLNKLWWYRLPLEATRFSDSLAISLTDGFYLTAWQRISSIAPLIALIVGLILGRFNFVYGNLYVFSIFAMGFMVAISTLGSGLGIWLWVGYFFSNFFIYPHVEYLSLQQNWFVNLIQLRLPLILTYILLAYLLVIIPLSSKMIVRRVFQRIETKSPIFYLVGQGILQAFLQGFFVFTWTQITPILIRPIFTWRGGSPSVPAISPLQNEGNYLVIITIVFIIIRIIVETFALAHSSAQEQANILQILFSENERPKFSLPSWVIAIIQAAFTTFILSGLLMHWSDVFLLGISVWFLITIKRDLRPKMKVYINIICRIPLLIRFATAVVINYFVSLKIIENMWSGHSSFLPIILSLLTSIIIFSLLVPNPHQPQQKKNHSQDFKNRLLVICLGIGLTFTLYSEPALADNCGDLQDCYDFATKAALVAASMGIGN